MQIQPINFGKTYISKTDVRDVKTGEKTSFNFVEYDDYVEDEIDIQNAAIDWGNYLNSMEGRHGKNCLSSNYAEEIFNDFQDASSRKDEHFYGLEDNNGEIYALCEITEGRKEIKMPPFFKNKQKSFDILFFITNPKHKHLNPNRKYSKIGTSFFKEIVKLADRKNFDYIALSDASHGFWDSLPSLETGTNNEDMEKTQFLRNSKFRVCAQKLDRRI